MLKVSLGLEYVAHDRRVLVQICEKHKAAAVHALPQISLFDVRVIESGMGTALG